MPASNRIAISVTARHEFALKRWATQNRQLESRGLAIAVGPPAMAWIIAMAAKPVLGGFPLVFACIVTLICFTAAAFMLTKSFRDRRLPLFVPTGQHTHDPYEAVPALLALLDEIKSPVSTPRRRQMHFEAARKALQATAGSNPLSLLVRHGYYPSRPEHSTESGSKVVTNHDQDGTHAHWDRAVKAISDLQILLGTDPDQPLTWRQVLKALAQVVPPLRAVCRNAGIDTHLVEYMPDTFITRNCDARMLEGAQPLQALPEPVTEMADHTEQPLDALSPVEGRMNAAAAMTAATIRTLILSFDAAEADIFVGDDLNTGRQIIDRQMPTLVRLFEISHDAAIGADRDDVRADFARSLMVVRDGLEQIMSRYTRNAREIMLTQTRFMESRYGDVDPLRDPANPVEAPVAG